MPFVQTIMPRLVVLSEVSTPAVGQVLKSAVTAEQLNGVLSEVIGLLPVVLPVAIGFMAIRKGIGFLMGMLHSA